MIPFTIYNTEILSKQDDIIDFTKQNLESNEHGRKKYC